MSFPYATRPASIMGDFLSASTILWAAIWASIFHYALPFLFKHQGIIVNGIKKISMTVRNTIELTALMIFSIGYFIIGVLNLIYKDPSVTYDFFNLLNNYHVFEISLVVGFAVSVIRNYRRAKTDPSKTAILVGMDFVFMLLGVFASQLVLLSFTYSQDSNLHLIAGSFGMVVIGANICRKQFLDFLACRIP
ncbi:hypothetical protein [Nitrosotalea sinensis]|nr:hypothetical protein [Candidatus Nitrosotalea sinensis]